MLLVGSQRSEQPNNINFEPIIRGFRNDIFDWDQVKYPLHVYMQKKKRVKILVAGYKRTRKGKPPRSYCSAVCVEFVNILYFE